MRSSRAAVNLIVSFEVGSKALYEKKYQRPEWPGVSSGITVGIGYDLGYNKRETIRNDWAGHLPGSMVAVMQDYSGLTGKAANLKLAEARKHILVPWDAAMDVFMAVSMPKFEGYTLKACPGSDQLPAGCFGVLTSLTYNRGASYTKEGDRYREMRNIRAHIASGRWDKVPAEIRAMKRLWPTVAGLRRRRDEEAALWEASLKAAPPLPEPDPRKVDTGDERDVTPEVTVTTVKEPEQLNVQPERGKYSLQVEMIQTALTSMGYYEVGAIDGKFGGKFVAGVAAFMTDRGKDPNQGKITQELLDEISKAKGEKLPNGQPWSRPIAPTRANATVSDIAPKVASVKSNWYQQIVAWFLGLPAAVGAGLQGIFGEDTAGGYLKQVKELFAQIPTEFYLLAIVGFAAMIYIFAKRAQDATVKDYQQGKIN